VPETVDKSALTGGRQYHVGVAAGKIAETVPVPGDPFRVAPVAERLDDAVEVAHQREYRTVNGTYRGVPVTVCSSGTGCPSTAIGVEEPANAGARRFVRVGSTAALQPGIAVGDLVVSEGSYRNDGTTAAYVPAGYPAVPDLRLAVALAAARRRGRSAGMVRAVSGTWSPATSSTARRAPGCAPAGCTR
jgi:uridine phosphorylase